MNQIEIVYHPLIIPTVVIPFTALLAALSALASFIAALFGIQLKAEGPKKLLEVMLKPRVLAVALATNLLFFCAAYGYHYWKNAPYSLWRIERTNRAIAKPSQLTYPDSLSGEEEIAVAQRPLQPGVLDLAWKKKLEAGAFGGAAVSGNAIFLGSDDGYVYEIDPASGETRRRFFVGTPVSATPTVFEGALYAGEGEHDTHHARVCKFDLATGNLAGTYYSPGHIEGELVAVRAGSLKALLVPTGGAGLVALNLANMQALWRAEDGHVDSASLFSGGLVFSGTGIEKDGRNTKKGSALAYELASGKKIWQRELPASSWMKPILWGEAVCFVYGEIYFPSDLGGVQCFRREDGRPDLSYNNAAPIAATPQRIGEDLLVSDIHGKICRVSHLDGRALWCTETGGAKMALGNPVIDRSSGIIGYSSQANGFFLLDPFSGKVLAEWKGAKEDSAKVYAPAAVLRDGWLLVDMKGNVHKLQWRNFAKTVAGAL